MPAVATAPGPKLSLLSSLIYRPGGGNPLDFFTSLARTYGDVSSYRMAGEQLFLVNEPRLIRDIVVTNNRNFTKSRGLERSKRLLGQGLLTSEGAMHRAALPKFAYFPFGGGPRQCIGESFAWMELVLVVATIAQQYRLRLVPGHPVVPQPLITLRARHGMRMTVEQR